MAKNAKESLPPPKSIHKSLREERKVTCSPERDQRKERSRLLEPWKNFDTKNRSYCTVTMKDDNAHCLNEINLELNLGEKILSIDYNPSVLELFEEKDLVVVPSYSRNEVVTLLHQDKCKKKDTTSGDFVYSNLLDESICYIIVCESDQLVQYQEAFVNFEHVDNLIWLVLPEGCHRGVLVARQLTKLFFMKLQEENMITQDFYFMMDDDITFIEEKDYKYDKDTDRYACPQKPLSLKEFIDYTHEIIDAEVYILKKGKQESYEEFNSTWSMLGPQPICNMNGNAQFESMEKFTIAHTTRVTGLMCIHIERSWDGIFCPIEWLWYSNEKWQQIQKERKKYKEIQFVFFQGEDFRCCALMTKKGGNQKEYPTSFYMKRIVCTYKGAKESVAQANNLTNKEEQELAKKFNKYHFSCTLAGELESGYENFSKNYKYYPRHYTTKVQANVKMGTISLKSSLNQSKVSYDHWKIIEFLMGDFTIEKNTSNIICKSTNGITAPAILPKTFSNYKFKNIGMYFDNTKKSDQIIIQYSNEDEIKIKNTLNLILEFLPLESEKQEEPLDTIKKEITEIMHPILEDTDKLEHVIHNINLFTYEGFSITKGAEHHSKLKEIFEAKSTKNQKSARSQITTKSTKSYKSARF